MGLTMYGQMTAGSWIYIGTQGILQGTYETFAACARQHFGGTLAGRLVVTAGLGGMGGAQPLAATMNGAAFLGVDVDPNRIAAGSRRGYCDVMTADLDEALRRVETAKRDRLALSVGLVGNIADGAAGVGSPRSRDRRADRSNRGSRPAHRLHPARLHRRRPPLHFATRRSDRLRERRARLDADPCRRDAGVSRSAARPCSITATTSAARWRTAAAWPRRSAFRASCRSTYGRCSARAAARFAGRPSRGDPADIAATDDAVLEPFPHKEALTRWIKLAREQVAFQGLPARICWLEYGERAEAGERFNRSGARRAR